MNKTGEIIVDLAEDTVEDVLRKAKKKELRLDMAIVIVIGHNEVGISMRSNRNSIPSEVSSKIPYDVATLLRSRLETASTSKQSVN
jgi:hypothetical protein